MPNLRLYRLAWLVAIVVAALSLVALRTPTLLPLDTQPLSFDGGRAMGTLRAVVEQFPERVAGEPNDHRCALWLVGQLRGLGLDPHVDRFTRVINGQPVVLENVWAVAGAEAAGATVLLAKRDSPPLATQGADDNASGIAAVLELARVLTVSSHSHPIIFLWTDGDSYGALGGRDFVIRHPDLPIVGAVALQQIADKDARAVGLNGWSAAPHVAPPWLWVLSRSAVTAESPLRAMLPNIVAQLLRLAVPCTPGSQGPFVKAGIPAITLSARSSNRQPAADTIDNVSAATLTSVGLAAERMVATIDAAPTPARSDDALFFSKYRQIRVRVLIGALIVLFVPLAVVTLDMWARIRRHQLRLWPAAVRLGLRLAPWYLTLAIVYMANLLSLLPRSPGAVVPPEAAISHAPRYLRVVLLVLFLALAYHYAMAVERRLARLHRADTRAVMVLTHLALLAIAALIVVVNPFSLVLLLPAAVLWPLARPGNWVRSSLPVWSGLGVVVAPIVYFGLRLHLGWKVWWYFFLLIENRTIPVSAVVLGVAFVATTALLGHELHSATVSPGLAVAAPLGGRRRRRRPPRASRTSARDSDDGAGPTSTHARPV